MVGGGGMGVVYRAQDLKLSRSVALKFLPEEFGSDPRAGERFEREARAASALDHPNICSIYEFGEHEGKPFIVMQLLQGQTLKDRLAMVKDERTGALVGKPLAVDDLLPLAIQVADGLEAAHEKGLLHRDIKPANIFITQRGVAKILDFGLVKLIEDAGDDDAADGGLEPASGKTGSIELSRAGFTVGTAAYMSPEQIRGEKLNHRTDLFCFGLVLYEMATGRRALAGADAAALRDAILNRVPVPARELNSLLPPKLERIINRCIEKDQNRRYQRAAEIRTDLEDLKRAREHPLRRRWKSLTASAVVTVLMATGGIYWYSHRPPKFTEKDTIVLADFNNTTGEAVWDGSLKTWLDDAMDSPYLNVLSDQQVSDTLKLMELPANARLTPEVAKDVCQRNSGKAVLAGMITKIGNGYEIDLNATNCQTGEKLAGSTESAKEQQDVSNALSNATSRVRGQLGENLASVHKYETPLPPATTGSLDAVKAYAMGLKLKSTGGGESAVPFFKRAIELDPNFADAYTALGATYGNMNQPTLALQSYKRAYELRDRLSPRERFHVVGHYYDAVTGELQKANQTYIDWIQVYPADWFPYQNLSANYSEMGQYEKAIQEEQTAMQLFPETVDALTALVGDYNATNQPEKAKAVFNQALSHKLDQPQLHVYRYDTAFLQADDKSMQQELDAAMSDPANQDWLLSAQSDTEAYRGRMENARRYSRQTAQAAKLADAPERAALRSALDALREAELGDNQRARAMATEALAMSTGKDTDIIAALALARAGDVAQAQKLADRIDRDFPQSTMVQNYALPVIRAAIELQKKNSAAAIETLQVALPYEMGSPSFELSLYPAYLRGEAYLMAGQGQQAAEEFQKFLDHPGVAMNFITSALARLQLGRALALAGERAAARKSYEDFLTLWRQADPGLPILKVAKAEHEQLQ